jgi:hypothetical protein
MILAQYFIYARQKKCFTLQERLFWPRSLAMLAVGVGTTIAVTLNFNDTSGGITAYSMNALMSISFCAMLLKRNSLQGQSFYIAFFKFLGTAITYTYIERPIDPLFAWYGVVIIGFDLAYIALVWIIGKRDNVKLLLRI